MTFTTEEGSLLPTFVSKEVVDVLTGCSSLPQIHLLQLRWRLLWAAGGCSNGLPSLCHSGKHIHEVFEDPALDLAPSIQAPSIQATSIQASIQFTAELERGWSLLFLYTLLWRKEDGSLDVIVYRKPMHTDQYLNFWSHHLIHVKRGLVRCLYDKAKGITVSQGNMWKEEDIQLRPWS